jgi:gas vesicle protein
MENNKMMGFGIGLLTGVIMGGAIALLFAPRTGKETREIIKNKAIETRDTAAGIADNVKSLAIETADKVKAAAVEVGKRSNGAVHAING